MRNIVAGNWKSNKLMVEARELMVEVSKGVSVDGLTDVILAPPAPFLSALVLEAAENKSISWAGQQCSGYEMGAYTGEFTASMLHSIGVRSVLIGHSERRDKFGESEEMVAMKLRSALDSGLTAILCCGEDLGERESGGHFTRVMEQLKHALHGVSETEMADVVLAYEPIWAIGTGRTASAAQAQEMHHAIREFIKENWGETIAGNTRILYGGSCKPSNAAEIFAQPDVNGGLIGGAALSAVDFLAIVDASDQSLRETN